MNVKKKLSLYFNIVIYISGTFILLTLLIIMTINFMNDARILAKPASAGTEQINNGVGSKPSEDQHSSNNPGNNQTVDNNEETQVYNRGFELVDGTVDGNWSNEAAKETEITVEVINFTGVDIYADQVIASLEAFGYKPERKSDYSADNPDTVIIDRTGEGLGKRIQNLLRFDNLIEEDRNGAFYDVTIIVGKDFMPPP